MSQRNIKVIEKQFCNSVIIPEVIKIINEGHTVTLPLKGYSMRPFLEDGRDKVLLTIPENLKVGDPVLAEIEPQHYVLHRIIDINGNDIVLRGDGNLSNEYCKKSDIRCAVIGFYRKGRTTLDRIDGKKWRFYSFLWMRLSPIRKYLLAFHRRIWLRIFPVKAKNKNM
ncbi:S24/S26 family peptidase [Prevotella sp. OH937_COT-195]|uniref:S24/S26 family peptidase n=1 Tax=Prevotella sp. OH937_COT-195 TaxID=2491051 RepID=UPI000F64912A|nr:S24/S26 family peptidase [Prevotella sp. OH937_COT-195]RRC99130.1 peptidase S41 [Prevotella sp. OH937_COT-195]